ncbi:MAG: M23 family metallopeptidase [Treponema sp.]|nr:M23 family metallopeptidase [Treponema sp.]
MKKTGKGIPLAFFLTCLVSLAGGEEGGRAGKGRDYPLIARLDNGDVFFRQFLEDVEMSRRRLFTRGRGETAADIAGSLTVYRYRPREGEDLFDIAARLTLPYAALASLNRLSSPGLAAGEALILPSVPGIFLPEEPRSELERLAASARAGEGDPVELVIGGERFRFFPGGDFSATERIFFLNPGFRFPLKNFRITSGYGPRRNPVTGSAGMHGGLDLAAPAGTDVFAAAAGVVTETGEDPVYGKYVIIKHGEVWASLYGHLSLVETALRREVLSGSLIGKVGSTGQSTGPHLHFELRRNGKTEDPGKYLFKTPGP